MFIPCSVITIDVAPTFKIISLLAVRLRVPPSPILLTPIWLFRLPLVVAIVASVACAEMVEVISPWRDVCIILPSVSIATVGAVVCV